MQLDFWFDFASTYSYLSAMRVADAGLEHDVEVRWRPFLLGPIFKAQGWDTSPFNIYEAKGHHMWRDMERLCEQRGLPLERPDPFPQASLAAARLAMAARDEQWFPDYCRGIFRAEFGGGQSISDRDTLSAVLSDQGVDPEAWLARADEQTVKDMLRAETDEAIRLGIFGAPSFVAGDELFWGDDRLDQAIEWAAAAKQ